MMQCFVSVFISIAMILSFPSFNFFTRYEILVGHDIETPPLPLSRFIDEISSTESTLRAVECLFGRYWSSSCCRTL